MASREQDKMVRELRGQGYQVTKDGHQHWRVCDRRGRYLATFPGTTCNWRWKDNLLTAIRRSERRLAQDDARAEEAS